MAIRISDNKVADCGGGVTIRVPDHVDVEVMNNALERCASGIVVDASVFRVRDAIEALPAGEQRSRLSELFVAALTDGRTAAIAEMVHKVSSALGLS